MQTQLASAADHLGDTPHLSHREQDAYYAALRGELRLVDVHVLTDKLGIRSDYARRILHNLHRKGAVDRVAKGQYAVVPPEVLFERRGRGVDPRPLLHELMARICLADHYFVAYQSAAQLHDAAHQAPFVLQVALARQRRPLRFGTMEVRFIRMDPRHFFGIEERHYQGAFLRVSDRERTALDLIDRPALGGGMEEVARTICRLIEGSDAERLSEYALRLGSRSTAQRLGYILEMFGKGISHRALGTLWDFRGRFIVPLEPGGASDGEVDRRWRVRINVALEDIEW